MYPLENEQITPIVARVLNIEDITTGGAEDKYLFRYRGKLYGESSTSYAQLSDNLRPFDITPMFRDEDGTHTILLMDGTVKPSPSKKWVNLVLFLLTILSMIVGYTWWFSGLPVLDGEAITVAIVLDSLKAGMFFTVSMLAILLAHEFGHYFAARYHRTSVTLPYFIPFPISPLGTLGAFIRLKEPPRNKRILLDIGIAGPIAGLIVAIPILLLGLSLSSVELITVAPGQGIQMEGNSILYLLSKYIVFGQLLPAPSSYEGLNPILYWVRYFFTGQPFPVGGLDVIISPIAWAGWAGLLVTALNLIPAGQLDGGHISYVLFGKRITKFLPVILVILVILGFFASSWWLFAALIFLLGRFHAEPLDQITPLDSHRRTLAIIGLVLFFLVFTPVPLIMYTSGG